MTQETRETLTELADELERVVLEVSSRDGDATARQHARAAALRDVLTPRTCSTCRHYTHDDRCGNHAQPQSTALATMAPDDGCLLGWQAREAAIAHCLAYRRLGWDEYCRQLREREE